MHKHFTTGEPCNCTWTKHLGWEPVSKTTSSLGKWKLVLMGGPNEVHPSDARATERPFIANIPDQTIYVGGVGGYHGTVYNNMPNGWGDHWRGVIHDDGTYEHLGAPEEDMGPEVNHLLREHGLTPIGGWENKFARVAKETPGQVARRWGELLDQYPDNSKVLHTTPEGYTIRHLPTFGDISRTGLHMRNCWQGLSSYSDQSREVDPWHIHQRYSLNDEKGHPQVAFFIKHPQHGADSFDISEPLGPRNKRPKPHYEQALQSWAAEKGYNYQEADYENPFLERNYGAVDPDDPTWDSLNRVSQIVEIPPHGENGWEDPAERPFLYDRQTGIIHLGHPGDAHQNIYDHLAKTIPVGVWEGRFKDGAINHTTGELNEFGKRLSLKEKVYVYGLLGQHLGVTPFEPEGWEGKFANTGHSLVWEPGWPGKAFYRPDTGELTTWGVNSTHHAVAWPHHTHMWGMRYPGEDMRAKASLLNIHPDGRVYEAHPDQGDWETTARAIQQIDPQLKPFEPEWEDMFSE